MSIKDAFTNWSIKIAVSKISRRAIPWVVGLLTGPAVAGKANEILSQGGGTLTIDPVALQAALGAGLSFVTNWAKVKFNLRWL